MLAPTDNAGELAYAITLDGQRLAAGAPGDISRSGVVYTYACSGQNCSAAAPLAPIDLAAGDLFGAAVSLSGNTLAIGAPGQGAGTVYVYFHDGFGWLLQQKLLATPAIAGDRFGAAVSALGNRVVVGAPGADNGAGSVYVFERATGLWTQAARLQASDADDGDGFGSSVASSADAFVVGAPQWSPNTIGSYSQGAAYVFQYNSPSWNQQARLQPSTAENGAIFGHAVSLSGDRALVGSPLASLRVGSAYVFERIGVAWTQQAQLASAGGLPGDRFGWSVALDGDQLLIGAPYSLAGCGGSTHYALAGGSWLAAAGPALAEATPGGLVGWSVATQAQRWLVGVPGFSGAPSHVGAAYWRDSADAVFNDGFDNAGVAVCIAH